MASLKERFEQMIHMDWSEFIELEQDKASSVDDVVLCSLIRTCADTDDMSAIKLAFDRVDGLLETPIEIKVPKFYVRYINAKEVEGGQENQKQLAEPEKNIKTNYDPATAKLRETLREMRSMPRDVIRAVKLYKKRIEDGKFVEHAPKVKSVIVANLLKNVTKGRFKAIELVFDQIDGKLARTVTLLGGEDVYVDDFNTKLAPKHSIKDEKGYYIAENKAMTTIWLRGFANSRKGLETLADGLESDEY